MGYCGGLWIAAPFAEDAGDSALSREWATQADAAKVTFNERLYNGRWFRVDTAGPFSDASFIEQLFGPFLARRLGLGDVVPETHARSALSEIYGRNYLDAGGGEGAVSLTGLSDAAVRCATYERARGGPSRLVQLQLLLTQKYLASAAWLSLFCNSIVEAAVYRVMRWRTAEPLAKVGQMSMRSAMLRASSNSTPR